MLEVVDNCGLLTSKVVVGKIPKSTDVGVIKGLLDVGEICSLADRKEVNSTTSAELEADTSNICIPLANIEKVVGTSSVLEVGESSMLLVCTEEEVISLRVGVEKSCEVLGCTKDVVVTSRSLEVVVADTSMLITDTNVFKAPPLEVVAGVGTPLTNSEEVKVVVVTSRSVVEDSTNTCELSLMSLEGDVTALNVKAEVGTIEISFEVS